MNQLHAAMTKTADDTIRVQVGIRRSPLPNRKPPNKKTAHKMSNPISQNRCAAPK
jgi:hypothetical protein